MATLIFVAGLKFRSFNREFRTWDVLAPMVEAPWMQILLQFQFWTLAQSIIFPGTQMCPRGQRCSPPATRLLSAETCQRFANVLKCCTDWQVCGEKNPKSCLGRKNYMVRRLKRASAKKKQDTFQQMYPDALVANLVAMME